MVVIVPCADGTLDVYQPSTHGLVYIGNFTLAAYRARFA